MHRMNHPAQHAFILALPDEVLVNILEHYINVVTRKKTRYRITLYCEVGIPGLGSVPVEASEYARVELAGLALVCRRFYPIATQILYKNLSLCYDYKRFKWDWITHFHSKRRDHVHKAAQTGSDNDDEEEFDSRPRPGPHFLYRTLMENPSLRQHCQKLRLTLNLCETDNHGAPNPALLQNVVKNMFTWLRKITMLDLQYTDELGRHDILTALSQNLVHLQELRTLAISHTEEIILPDLYYAIIRKLPKLQSLAVEEAGCCRGGEYGTINYAERFPSSEKLKLPPPSLASVTFYGGFYDNPRNLEWFLRQPLRLTHFSFYLRYYGHGSGPDGWSLPVLLTLLRHQRQTLRCITIGHIYDGTYGLSGVDLSGFEALEELTLDFWFLATWSTAPDGCWEEHLAVNEGQAVILSAPKLRKLTLCFDRYERCGPHNLTSFGEEQGAWLRELVTTAVRERKALRHVHLDYKPGKPRKEERARVQVWPWGRIDRVQDIEEVREAGIRITYEDPPITEKEFDEMLVEV